MTDFQAKALQEVEKLFASISNLEWNNFQEVVGRRETYLKGMVKAPRHIIEIFIYEDEAGYLLEGGQWTVFEKPDYNSPNQLLAAFVMGLQDKLQI